MNITTIEMEVALMSYFNFTQNIIVPNVKWGLGVHECDLFVVSKQGYATEVEIKVSKSDLLKDKEKSHSHVSDKIKQLWFAVPEELKDVALQHVPERAGVLYAQRHPKGHLMILTARKPKVARNARQLTDQEINHLMRLGCMRIHSMKKRIIAIQKGKDDDAC